MNKKHYSIVFILALILIILGVYNTFTFWWGSKIDPPFIGMSISFYCFGGSAILFSGFLTYVFFVPKNIIFNFFSLTNNRKIEILQKEIGKSKVNKIRILSSILFISLLILTAFTMYFILGKYERYQLQNFGKEQTIEISEVAKSDKGFDVAVVKYEYGGKLYTKQFYLKKYKPGEKVEILFSTHNPNIAVWNDEFKLVK